MKKTFKNTILLFALAFCFPVISFAAEVFLQTESKSFTVGDKFIVDVSVNTENDLLNAVEGTLVFPQSFLEVKEIRKAESSVNFWIEEPQVSAKGAISFTGMTPGGFSGSNESIFSIVFQAMQSGNEVIEIEKIKLLRNDGQGTEVDVETSTLSLSISEKSAADASKVSAIEDTEPPENFTPAISSDPNIFDGKHFLVFATQDKGSGINHYEVREGFFGKFILAESPYLLTNQDLNKNIYVKAVDALQNEKIVSLSPQKAEAWYQQYEIFAILVLIGIVLFALKKLWSRFFA